MPVMKYLDGVWTTHPGPEGSPGLPGAQGAQGPVNPLNVGRNRLINGNFIVGQRGLSSAVGNYAGTYVFDHWIGYSPVAGGTFTQTNITATTGELPESSPWYLRLTSSGYTSEGSTARLCQKIESVRTLSGKTVTLSFWAKAATNGVKVALMLAQDFGTGESGGGGPARDAPAQQITFNQSTKFGFKTLTTSWVRYSATADLPPLNPSQVFGTNGDDSLLLSIYTVAGNSFDTFLGGNLGLQNTSVDIWGVQVEEGPVATLFETRTYDEQFRACQRYFQRLHQPSLRGQAGATEYCTRMSMPLPVQMRKVPSVSVGGTMYVWDGIQGSSFTTISESYSTAQTLEVQMHTAGAFTAVGRSIVLYQTGTTGYFDLNAEF